MKVFITGATGYIGEQLALALAARQFEVVALVRSPEQATTLRTAGITLLQGDLDSVAVLEKGMQQCQAVLHLAAYARLWPENEAIFRKVNIEGTCHVADAALKNKVQRLIFTSTAGVFGPSASAAEPVTEDTNKSVPHTSAYEATKAEAEKLLKTYVPKGLEVIILNPTRVYGPGKESESNAVNKLISLYMKGKWRFLPGNGQSIGNYCFTEDIVSAHINAIALGKSGHNYLLGGHNISYKELFDSVAQVTGQHHRLYKVPAKLLHVVSQLLVAGAKLTNSKPLLTPKWLQKYLNNWCVSSQKAQKELQYTITPLAVGLKKTIDYIKE
ncbi:NAD-dependent epimerase/dehydratase family protein [Pontibacter qinzhouensis]|uniref:NAD-dependent epimerase/dehydratase family protein n=1 Tax=Pontibacter qinzhouensis TaxID=2603253 RepID=A0A5C8K5U0_9BACT|nr:NAD-dependent epimerase/dehydratase family protein [Pontibacter qinzhouensis]TXK46363.1 NAD-dependent epimerase/dehydratase family protein [Pontibacter qinzhouensis]